jgi:hypothetical protein
MRVDDFLATAPLPDVAVDTEDALARTRRRGTRRQRRRTTLAGLGAVLAVTAGAAIAVQLTGGDGRDPDRVATGPDPAVSTTAPAPPSPASEPEAGDGATWRIDPAAPPAPSDSSVSVLVTRLDCHGGGTGRVLRPGVVFDEAQVTVTFTVEAETSDGAFTCQGNDEVAQEVDLGQPLGDRALVDGSCLSGGAADGLESLCPSGSGVRWQPLQPPLRAVSGVLVMEGGPAGAEPTPVPGTIQVLDEAGRPVAATTTDGAGRFTVEVPAGTYQLLGYSPHYVDGEWSCSPDDLVTVADGDVADVAVECVVR